MHMPLSPFTLMHAQPPVPLHSTTRRNASSLYHTPSLTLFPPLSPSLSAGCAPARHRGGHVHNHRHAPFLLLRLFQRRQSRPHSCCSVFSDPRPRLCGVRREGEGGA